ncbi:class I SAM-dependent methyltransferase [bacterium]|jgi:ubiquinone/menaquinone biosynthesis C-methylase UbiE|nr:class I SAM-dependent methyltransferase [bacterium]
MKTESFGQGSRSVLDMVIMKIRFNKIASLIPKGLEVLDIGCGYNAELLTTVEGKIKTGVGIDMSVNTKFKSSLSKIKLVEGRVDEKLPFKDNSFDSVSALAIIEHVEKPKMMLTEILRVLKPGGVVLLTTPPLISKPILEFMARLGIISRAEIADHKRYYTKKGLSVIMKKIGFSNISIKYFGIFWLNLIGTGNK